MKTVRHFAFAMIGLASLYLAVSAQAFLIVHEGFDYPSATFLPGQNGGTGWLGAWIGPNLNGTATTSGDQPFALAGGLSWKNGPGYITGVGRSIRDEDDGGPNHSIGHGDARKWFDPTTDFTTLWGTNIWFSCLATYDVVSTSGGVVIPFEAGYQAYSGIGVTFKGGAGAFQVYIRQNGAELSTNSVNYLQAQGVLTNVALVVGRFQLGQVPLSPLTDRGNDRLDVWLNQTKEPTNNSTLFMTGFHALRTAPYSQGYLVVRTGGSCQITVDEIKIGTRFADVVPVSAASDNPKPNAPELSLDKAGPVGLQFNAGAGTSRQYNEIESVPEIECSWVGNATPAAPAVYSFTISNPPASGSTNFTAFVWLVANPNGFISAEVSNPNVVRLAIQSDGSPFANASLGYKINESNSTSKFSGAGFLCGLTNVPFAGRWSLTLTNDTGFILRSPNGNQAVGSMPDEVPAGYFQNQVRFYLGVTPNGAQNIGRFMTVSDARIRIPNSGVDVFSDFTSGEPLDSSKWTILADDPASIISMPVGSLYRATWRNAFGAGVGPNSLLHTNVLGSSHAWPVASQGILLGNSTNVVFITRDFATNAAEFFQVSVPFTP